MMEEGQAQANLVSLSQQTHYLSDWNDKYISLKRKKQQKQTQQEGQTPKIRREASQKNDLRKCEVKMQSLHKIEYPILEDCTCLEDSFVLPKFKQPISQVDNLKGQIKRRDDFNKQINRLIEEGLVKKKLDHFRKKIETLQKNIYQSEQKYRPNHLPRSFLARKNSRMGQQLQKQINEPKRIDQLKNQLESQKRKYSMPNLAKISTSRYMDYIC